MDIPPNELSKVQALEAMWQTSSEAHLAYHHPENIITDKGVDRWLKDLQVYNSAFPDSKFLDPFRVNSQLDTEKLKSRYQEELRILSRSDIIQGLQQFGNEISAKYSPQDTLFYFPPESESARLMYATLMTSHPNLAEFGTAMDSHSSLNLWKKNHFSGSSPSDARAFVYVDDWVLSADHMKKFLTKDVAGKLNTFHLAVSDAGLRFFRAASQHITPRFKYKVKSDDPNSFYADVPIYGAHKIPDRIPEYYASLFDSYSIFGYPIKKNARLVNHSRSLVAD